MANITMFWVESATISALLYLLYCGLFKGKASYFAQRVLLLSIPVIATLSAVISFEFIELRGWGGEVLEEIVIDDEAATEANQLTREDISTEGFKIIRSDGYHFGIEDFTLSVWAIISLVLLSLFVWRLTKIISLRRVSTKETHSDYSIYRLWSGEVIFSFWRGIYIGGDLEGERCDFVLRHELEHIRRCHYVDKLLAEVYSIFIWFNPAVRVIQRELSLIHEYEADHAVVESGCDLKAYKTFIFEAITAPVPTFANGINSSQIKKRFIAMKKSNQVSHRVLRALMTIVAFISIAAISMVYVEARESDKGEEMAPCVDARRDQIYVTHNMNYNRPIYVVRCEDHTKLYMGGNVVWNRHWFVISEQMYLIDPKSGDKYTLHSSGTGLPLEEVIWVVNAKDKYVYFELIFPPLDKGVDRVDFEEWSKAATTVGYPNRGATIDHRGWHFSNVKVENDLPYFVSAEYQAKQDKNFESK